MAQSDSYQLPPYSLKGKRVWIAGHRGMVGGALMRRLAHEDCELLTAERSDIDLRRQSDVERWMNANRPDAVLVAAAKVGGILANDALPGEFLYDNLAIELNIIDSSWKTGVEKLLFLGSSCIYPRLAPQPIPESALLTGPLESTNEWYAIAKIAGLKLCQAYRKQYGCNFISAMPTNLYGPGDNFDLESSHVVPALIRKAHEAKVRGDEQIEIWGTGNARREFLYVDDCADALVFLMNHYSEAEPVNIGSGSDLPIIELAHAVCGTVEFRGTIACDPSKPDGTPRKLLNSERLRRMGWTPRVALKDGLTTTYASFLAALKHSSEDQRYMRAWP